MWNKIRSKIDLLALIILAGILNIFKIGDLGYGNTYYAAAIKSMQTSFSNFFFLSLDSTGFISVDKSPLSLWVDAVSAKIFGFSGLSILLPHALEGILVTILVYLIVRKVNGRLPAFIASLLITLSPVNVAVYRNNTPDALLLVFILLAIVFAIKYFDSAKIKFLVVAGIMLGLGFNTKMLQAYLILPSFLGAIMVFAPGKIWQRIKPLIVFLAATFIISFSWITIVDLIPADLRPYVGSSENNSAWNLAFGYNGTQRLEGESSVGGNAGFNVGEKGLSRLFTGEMGSQTGWFLASALLFSGYFLVKEFKLLFTKFKGNKVAISSYKVLTFINILFLGTEYVFFSYASFFHSYYLNIFAIPIAFLMGALFYELYQSRLNNRILLAIIFSSLFVQVYLIKQANYAAYLIPLILIIGSLSLITIISTQLKKFDWQEVSKFMRIDVIRYSGLSILVIALFLTPLVWSGYTTYAANTATAIFVGGPTVGDGVRRNFNGQMPPTNLPDGGNSMRPGRQGMDSSRPQPNFPQDDGGNPFSRGTDGQLPNQNAAGTGMPGGNPGGAFGEEEVNEELLSYLKQNYNDEKYFVAVESAQSASGFILEENIGNIMVLGGFSGRDKAISLEDLQAKITNGEIRFFYFGGKSFGETSQQMDGNQLNTLPSMVDGSNGQGGGLFNGNQDITNWVQQNCTAVDETSNLYDCQAK